MGNIVAILDLGEFSTKIGFAGENEPRQTFYTLVGKPKYQNIQMSNQMGESSYYVGNEVADSMGLYKISRPVQMGHIKDWTLFEQILDYIFYQLRVDPSAINVLYTFHPLMNNDEKKKIFKLFFEKYQVAGFYFILDSLLTMYSGGFQTGLVVEMGASSIRVIPIYEGILIEHAIQYIEIGGTVLDNFMFHQLQSAGFSADTSVQKELVRVLKERACFVSLDYDEDLKRKKNYKKEYSLPDSSIIELSEERFTVPELLFKPYLNNLEEKSLPEAILDCIDLCDIDLRTPLLENIFLSGGASQFPQLEYRLLHELEVGLVQRGKKMRKPHIIAPKGRIFSCWIGGSILSYIPEFQASWITRGQYYNGEIPENLK
ncbi:MAG: actin family protein [archaeon]|nr:actin family protein [archaeon]